MAITVKTKLANTVNHASRQNVDGGTLVYDFWAPIAIDGETYRRAVSALKTRDPDAKLDGDAIRRELQRIALAGFRAEIKKHRPDNAAEISGFDPPKPKRRTRKPAAPKPEPQPERVTHEPSAADFAKLAESDSANES